MKRIIFIVILFLLLSRVAYADAFQIVDRSGRFYVAYSPVYYGRDFIGYIDKYGRIFINFRRGTYPFLVY